MSTTTKGLGRGLNALFNTPDTGEEGDRQSSAPSLLAIKIEDLLPSPDQPREAFNNESLQDLASSLKSRGVLQPILVRPAEEEGKYYIVAGERRWRAATLAGLETIPALVKDYNSSDAIITTMVENLHREDLSPLEEAKGLAHIMDLLQINQTELAHALGVQRGSITNILRILRLSPQAKDDLSHNRITQGHARCLVTLPPAESENLRQRIIDNGMSVRATEMALSLWNQTKQFPWERTGAPRGPKPTPPIMKKLGETLSISLKCPAKIRGTAQKGKINLSYESSEQLYELLEKLGLSEADFKLEEEE